MSPLNRKAISQLVELTGSHNDGGRCRLRTQLVPHCVLVPSAFEGHNKMFDKYRECVARVGRDSVVGTMTCNLDNTGVIGIANNPQYGPECYSNVRIGQWTRTLYESSTESCFFMLSTVTRVRHAQHSKHVTFHRINCLQLSTSTHISDPMPSVQSKCYFDIM